MEKRSDTVQYTNGRDIFLRHILPVLLISVLSFAIYSNTLRNGFVYDDEKTIVTNTLIKDIHNLPLLFSKNYPELSTELSYRPVVTFTYFLDHLFFGLNPAGYHLMNIILHSLNGILLYFFLKQLLSNPQKALLISLFFASHPVLSEAVNAISFREDLLVFLFYFGTLNIYLFVKQKERSQQAHSQLSFNFLFIASCILYFLALLSKEMAATLPLIIIFYDWLYRDRHVERWSIFNRYYIGFLIVTIFYLHLRFFTFYRPIPDIVTHWELHERMLTLPWLLSNYVKVVLFPVSLSSDYDILPVSSFASLNLLFPLIFVLVSLISAFLMRKQKKEITFGILFLFITLMPVYNIIPIAYFFAERFLYLPIVGMIILMGGLAYDLLKSFSVKVKCNNTILLIYPILILSLYSFASIDRNQVWKNDASLWADTVKKMPSLSRAHFSLGSAYTKTGEFEKAIEQFQIALKLKPDYGDAYLNLGNVYNEKGKYDEALEYYQMALQFSKQELYFIYTGIGVSYLRLGKFDEAIKQFQIAIRMNPRFSIAHYNLGVTYFKKGMNELAKSEFKIMSELDPDDPDVRKYLRLLE